MKAPSTLFFVSVLAILILATYFRFVNYGNRWGLAHDQASFAIAARHALDTRQLPLLGPFSSGGPFQTSGVWYWLVMLGTLLNPASPLSPWIFLTLLSLVFVVVVILFSFQIGGVPLAVISGILATISPSQILQSTNLTNQTPISLFAALALWSQYQHIRTKRVRDLFLVSFWIGVASAIHLQGFALLPLILVSFLITRQFSFRALGAAGLGLVLPWLPVLMADSQNNFTNTGAMWKYFTAPYDKAFFEVVGRRWMTFLSFDIPGLLGHIVGGYRNVFYLLMAILALITILELKRKKLPAFIKTALYDLGLMIIILRYTRTPLFDSFVMFLHPWMILLLAYAGVRLWQWSRILGAFLLITVMVTSLQKTSAAISQASNKAAVEAAQVASELR